MCRRYFCTFIVCVTGVSYVVGVHIDAAGCCDFVAYYVVAIAVVDINITAAIITVNDVHVIYIVVHNLMSCVRFAILPLCSFVILVFVFD